jgi:hypothetical protein
MYITTTNALRITFLAFIIVIDFNNLKPTGKLLVVNSYLIFDGL